MTQEEKSILVKAIVCCGPDHQKSVAIEELSELIKEICKDIRGMLDIEHLSEEIADVEIMIEQLKIIYSVRNLTEDYRKNKIKRIEERIKMNKLK